MQLTSHSPQPSGWGSARVIVPANHFNGFWTDSHTKELLTMSTHSYSRLWIHLIWETLNREPMLDKRAAAKASAFLSEYGLEWRFEKNH